MRSLLLNLSRRREGGGRGKLRQWRRGRRRWRIFCFLLFGFVTTIYIYIVFTYSFYGDALYICFCILMMCCILFLQGGTVFWIWFPNSVCLALLLHSFPTNQAHQIRESNSKEHYHVTKTEYIIYIQRHVHNACI